MSAPIAAIADGFSRRSGEFVKAHAARWLPLGRGAFADLLARRHVGHERLDVGDRLSVIAETLRAPYVQLVADAGRDQEDKLLWYAGHFPSKSPLQDDSFLLLCQLELAEQLLQDEDRSKSPLCLYVEDPWLFEELRDRFGGHESVVVLRSRLAGAITRRRLAWLCEGLAKRAGLALLLAWSWMWVRLARGSGAPVAPSEGPPRVGVVSYARAEYASGDGAHDPYLGGLAGFLRSEGVSAFRVWHPSHRVGWAVLKGMRRLRGESWPLILELRWRDFLQLLRFWKAGPWARPERADGRGAAFRTLGDRATWAEARHAGTPRLLILHALLRRFFARGWCDVACYPFENQPWEKMLCMAADGAGRVRLVGSQHSTVPQLLLNYYLAPGEFGRTPLPDLVVAAGEHWAGVLRSAGYPAERVVVGGSWRYAYTLAAAMPPRAASPTGRKRVLVVLPVDPRQGAKLVAEVLRAAAGYGERTDRVPDVKVRTHPLQSPRDLRLTEGQLARVSFASGAFHECVADADLVVYQNTSAGLEAWLLGSPVLRVAPSDDLDIDSLRGFAGGRVFECTAGSLGAALRAGLDEGGAQRGARVGRIPIEAMVSEVRGREWLRALGAMRAEGHP